MANEGYMIVRINSPASTRPFIVWVAGDAPIAQGMARWLERGVTMEILEYVPNVSVHNAINFIPQLNLWGDLLKEQDQ